MSGKKPSRATGLTDPEVRSLVELVGAGLTPEQIGERLARDPESIRVELERLAINPVPPPGPPQGRFPPTSGY